MQRRGDPEQQAAAVAAGSEVRARRVEDLRLQLRETAHVRGVARPAHLRMAAQGAEAAAWRINQYPVELADESLESGVTFICNQLRMDIG